MGTTKQTPVQFKLTPATYDKLANLARQQGYRSPGLYVRAMVGQIMASDLAPPRSHKPTTTTDGLTDEQREALRSIARVAANFNQIARKLNRLDPLTADLSRELRKNLDALNALSRSIC